MDKEAGSKVIEGYMDEFCPKPVLKEYEPNEWDKDIYNTPKRMAKHAEKRNREYAAEYERKMKKYNGYLATKERILGMPAELMEFFVGSTSRFVERTREIRKGLAEVSKKFWEKYAKSVEFTYRFNSGTESQVYVNVKYDMYEIMGEVEVLDPDTGSFKFREFANMLRRAKFNALCPTDEQKREFVRDVCAYRKAENELRENPTTGEVFFCMMENVDNIIAMMEKVLGGKPEKCERCSHWGVGGKYNGLVARGDKRASFKSFYAGGWNIQRLHIRCKVTLLKNN